MNDAFRKELLYFQQKNNVLLPFDFQQYLINNEPELNNCNDRLFEFYSLQHIRNVKEHLKNWAGIPDYSNIVHTLKEDNCFAFADYMFHLSSYGICLHCDKVDDNFIYVICGDKYRPIASSFTHFTELYNADAPELYF